MSEIQRRILEKKERRKHEEEEQLRKQKEREERKRKRAEAQQRKAKEVPRVAKTIPAPIDETITKELLNEQKSQTKLLEELVGLLKVQPSSILPQATEITGPQEIKALITNYIRGQLPYDSLPSRRTHRSYRDDEFVDRLRNTWKINISKANARLTRKRMEENGELVSIGYLRFILPEFVLEYEQKTSPKDLEMINWLQVHSSFTSKEFKKSLYPSAPRGAASSKIHALIRKGWLARTERAHYHTTDSLPRLPKRD